LDETVVISLMTPIDPRFRFAIALKKMRFMPICQELATHSTPGRFRVAKQISQNVRERFFLTLSQMLTSS
jgi:hypothetical protein